jgi:hypothetical protein
MTEHRERGVLSFSLVGIYFSILTGFRTLYWIIKSILGYSFKSVKTFLDVVSNLLTLIIIINWIKIISQSPIVIDKNGKSPDIFGKVYEYTNLTASYQSL